MTLSPILDPQQRLPSEVFNSIIIESCNCTVTARVCRAWRAATEQHFVSLFHQGTLSQYMPHENGLSPKEIIHRTLDAACLHLKKTNPAAASYIKPRIFFENPDISDIEPYEESAHRHEIYEKLKTGITFNLLCGEYKSYPPINLNLPTDAQSQSFMNRTQTIQTQLKNLYQSQPEILDNLNFFPIL